MPRLLNTIALHTFESYNINPITLKYNKVCVFNLKNQGI